MFSRSYSTPKNLHITRPFYFVISNRCWKQTYEPGKEPMHRGRAPAGTRVKNVYHNENYEKSSNKR